MPGDLTTTSQPARASRPPASLRSTSSPSTGPASPSSTSTRGSAPSDRSFLMLARPSTRAPHTPTVRPRRSGQESRGRIPLRGVGGPERGQEPLHVRGGERAGRRGQAGQQRVAPAVVACGREGGGGPALGDVADALERLEVGRGAEQGEE